MTLAYTIERLLTQLAVIERDADVLDAFGGERKVERKVIATVPARFWWWREGGARSASREYATPTRSIDFTGGGVLVPLGTDIRDGDSVAAVQSPEGETLISGPFRVVAVEVWEDHLECALMRP